MVKSTKGVVVGSGQDSRVGSISQTGINGKESARWSYHVNTINISGNLVIVFKNNEGSGKINN